MRKQAILVLAMVVLLAASASAGTYSGGDGSANNPYQIATPEDLNDIGNHPEDFNDCFILVNDINMAGFTYTTALIAPDTDSSSGFQGTAFTGIFDGNDCNISNLTIDTAGAGNDFLGLFGRIEGNGMVKNLAVEDVNIAGGDDSQYIGGLCGYYEDGTIRNCRTSGSIFGGDGSSRLGGFLGYSHQGNIIDSSSSCFVCSGNSSRGVGGFVGGNYEATIRDCYTTGDVQVLDGSRELGGFVGYHDYGSISNCYAKGNVQGGENSSFMGAFAGENGSWDCWCALIKNCFAEGNVYGGTNSKYLGGLIGIQGGIVISSYCKGNVIVGNNSEVLGGFAGVNLGEIYDCYSISDVNGIDIVSGFIGYNVGWTPLWSKSIVQRCYSAGYVVGQTNIGGFIGYSEDEDDETFEACFWDTDVNPYVNGIGNTTDPNVKGKTTAEMQRERTFVETGWDFVEIWNIGENQTYPYLRVYPAGDLNHDGRVDFFDFAIAASHWLKGEGYD